jgi:hypothetical protein
LLVQDGAMGIPRSTQDCTHLVVDGVPPLCTTQGKIIVIDQSWGVPGLGTEGTIALGTMAIAAVAMTIFASRALLPARRPAPVTRR